MTEKYLAWAESWGLSLGYAVTQSVEKAERAVADAVVALTLQDQVTSERFAGVLWEFADREAYRGFGSDLFFRMPAIARAAVVLKLKARFTRAQIASALKLSQRQLDSHLENARLLFSDGKSWTGATAGLEIEEDRWVPNCKRWSAEAPIPEVFSHYIGNDLDPDTGTRLHEHMADCDTCRTSFSYFKKQYLDWASSVPSVEPDNEFKKQVEQVTLTALKLKNRKGPSPWPGLLRVIDESQVRVLLASLAVFFILQMIFSKKL
ncbi:MAG: hypothetical protein AB1540_11450 [Bdellovibrionota bacterium]